LDEGSITSELVQMVQQSGGIGTDLTSYVDRLVSDSQKARQDRLTPAFKSQALHALSPRETTFSR